MSKLFRTIGGFLLMMALLLSMSVSAFARTRIDVDADASLTLTYVDEDDSTALSGADFRLYKVAEIDETDQYKVTEDFQIYQVNLDAVESASGWLDLAATLSAYAARDNIEPLKEGTTDGNGKLTFSGLSVGLYLVVSDPLEKGDYTYTSTPYLVSLPNLDENDQWVYHVTSNVKKEKEKNGGDTPVETTRSVVKVWKGDTDNNRPASVTVQLLRNGEVYKEVSLSADNNWSYTWTGLSGSDIWQLTEKTVPEDYTVAVSQDGTAFTVTNTYKSEEEPVIPENTDGTDNPDKPVTTTPSDGSGSSNSKTLVQTGQLWWPVPLLAGCGLALFAVGWVMAFRKREKNA